MFSKVDYLLAPSRIGGKHLHLTILLGGRLWAHPRLPQLRKVGCETSSFNLNGLPAVADRPFNDLNDALRANGRGERANLFYAKPE
jgi:hypothetical protein